MGQHRRRVVGPRAGLDRQPSRDELADLEWHLAGPDGGHRAVGHPPGPAEVAAVGGPGVLAGQTLEEHGGGGVHVRGGRRVLAGPQFRRKVVRVAGRGRMATGGAVGQAGVDQLDFAVEGDDDVLRLDVAVRHAAALDLAKTAQRALDEEERGVRVERAGGVDELAERDAVDVLAHDRHCVGALDELVHLRHIRVLDRAQGIGIAAQPVDELR